MKVQLSFLYSMVFVFVSIILYFFAPEKYSLTFTIACLVMFILTFLFYIKNRKKKVLFCFSVVFSISYLFVYFIYPVFVYPFNKVRYFLFNYSFNDDNICKATALALIGYCCFIAGNFYKYREQEDTAIENGGEVIGGKYLLNFVLAIFVFLEIYKFFVLGFSRYNGSNVSISGVWDYIDILHHAAFMSAIVITYYNLYIENSSFVAFIKKNLVMILLLAIDVLVYLAAGERTQPLSFILAFIAGYYIYKGKLSLTKLIGLCCVGFLALDIVGMMRVGESGTLTVLDMTGDLVINNYTLYLGYDYVNTSGNEVFPLFGYLIRSIPFLLGIICKVFRVPYNRVSSADFFTYLLFGDNPPIGAGTNIISSIYLSLGIIGVIVLMYFLGIVSAKYESMVKASGIMSLAIYFELMGVAVYLVRSDYFYPVPSIIWTLLFVFLFSKKIKIRR